MSVETLLKEAGVQFEVPGVMEKLGADAIFDGDLSSLGLEVNDNGELVVDLDEAGEGLMGDGADGEGDEDEEEGEGDDREGEKFDEEGEEDYGEAEGLVEEDEVQGEGDGEGDDFVGELMDSNLRRCPHCEQTKHKKSIKRHIRDVHLNVKVSCDLCGLQLTNMNKLGLHMTKVHGIGAPGNVQCNFCEKTFIDQKKASFHETTIHPEMAENPFQCPACEKTFKTKPNMQRHVRAKHYL